MVAPAPPAVMVVVEVAPAPPAVMVAVEVAPAPPVAAAPADKQLRIKRALELSFRIYALLILNS